MLTMKTYNYGDGVKYLVSTVAPGRESYYTAATDEGEPPGRWYGQGAARLGLEGLVDHDVMEAVYSARVDPRDERIKNRDQWGEANKLGQEPRQYRSVAERTEAALSAEPHATAERREQIRMSVAQSERQAVSFLDATFTAQKSVSVVHAAFELRETQARQSGDTVAAARWAAKRQSVEDAIWAGNNAALDFLERKAGGTRVGYHSAGVGRWADTHGLTAASFFQHDTRPGDPNLHIHNAIVNRVEREDGQFGTLDSKAFHAFRPGAAAVAERTMEEHLTRTLAVRWKAHPDGTRREIDGVSQELLDEFSTAAKVNMPAKVRQLAAELEAATGRPPTAKQLDRLRRLANQLTRPGKAHTAESRAEVLRKWDEQGRRVVQAGLGHVADIVAETPTKPVVEADRFDMERVAQQALARLQATRATFTLPRLMQAVNACLDGTLGLPEGVTVADALERTARYALEVHRASKVSVDARPAPAELTRADGRSVFEAPASDTYATDDQLAAELRLRRAAVRGGAAAADSRAVKRHLAMLEREGVELRPAQRAAMEGVLTSGAVLETMVGPAGTGKSFVVGQIARAWQDPAISGGRVFGLATSQKATNNLADEGVQAKNTTQWLATQKAIVVGLAGHQDYLAARARLDEQMGRRREFRRRMREQGFAQTRWVDQEIDRDVRAAYRSYRELARYREPVSDWHKPWMLSDRDIVALDEAGMSSTQEIDEIRSWVESQGAKLLLLGDHRQLAAVGAGGGMGLAAAAGRTYELADVRRFNASWEGPASLRLRDGDGTVLTEYRKRGRIVDGGMGESTLRKAVAGYLGDHLAGKNTALVVNTNEQAAQAASMVQERLVDLGKVAEGSVELRDGTSLGVGDLIQTRKNEWDLKDWKGNARGPINRETYVVQEVRADGSLVVTPTRGRGARRLPAGYVAEHVTLGYAATVHSTQGQTLDTCHSVINGGTERGAAYVALTRGQECNTAYVETVELPEQDAVAAEPKERSAVAVLRDVLERGDDDLSALETMERNEEEARSARTLLGQTAEMMEQVTLARTASALDGLTATGSLTDRQRELLAADRATGSLARLLRQAELAGHDLTTVLADAVDAGTLDGARSPASVLHSRVAKQLDGKLTPLEGDFASRVPTAGASPGVKRYLDDLARDSDTRTRELGTEAAATSAPWAVNAFGPVPKDTVDRLEWEARAGRVAVHREAVGHTDEQVPLCAAPPAGQTEHLASWHTAHVALGKPESIRREEELTVGQLLIRVHAWKREEAWAPDYVADEMEGTNRVLAEARQRAAIAEAAGKQEEAADARIEAELLAARAAELEEADRAREAYLAATAATKDAHDRAQERLAELGEPAHRPKLAVTMGEWLQADIADREREDKHRPIHEHDMLDHDKDVVFQAHEDHAETAVPDVREVAAEARPRAGRGVEGVARVPTPLETARTMDRARTAVAEMAARRAAERAYEDRVRDQRLAQDRADSAGLADELRSEDVLELNR